MTPDSSGLVHVLDGFEPRSPAEAEDLGRIRHLLEQPDGWSRSAAVHLTGSALITHPPTRRVLLRWHERMQAWLQVGGHADADETDAYTIALREAREETGLADLKAWPSAVQPRVIQVAIVPVPAGRGEPAHQHADIRFVLATGQPEAARPESTRAAVVWLGLPDALERVTEDNLRTCLLRVAALLPPA